MRKQLIVVTVPVCLCIVVAGAWMAAAGDLDPPPGPIGPTMTTLSSIENMVAGLPLPSRQDILQLPANGNFQHHITQPGAYFLSGTLQVAAPSISAIQVSAGNVVIDLNGQAILSTAGVASAIKIDSGLKNVIIRNGAVFGFTGGGHAVNAPMVKRVTIENLDVDTGVGFEVGDECVIRSCRITAEAESIKCGKRCVIEDNVCTSTFIAGAAILATGDHNRLVNNFVTSTVAVGISVGADSTVESCEVSVAAAANQVGITTGDDCTVQSCKIDSSKEAIVCTNRCRIIDNLCERTSNGGFVIEATGTRNTIDGCTVRLATGITSGGITTGDDCIVQSCDVDSFAESIVCANRCQIIDNTCRRSETGFVIQVTGTQNTIDGCLLRGSGQFAIDLVGTANRVMGTTTYGFTPPLVCASPAVPPWSPGLVGSADIPITNWCNVQFWDRCFCQGQPSCSVPFVVFQNAIGASVIGFETGQPVVFCQPPAQGPSFPQGVGFLAAARSINHFFIP